MDFEISQDAKETAAGLVEFINRFVVPLEEKHRDILENERDRTDARGYLIPEVLELKKQVRMASAEAGFYTLFGDESLGGAGLGETTLVHVQEELNRNFGPSRTLIHENVVPSVFTNGLSPILLQLKEHIRNECINDIGSGAKTLCFGLSEPGAGSDAQRIKTRAVKDGDDWVINGSKQWISNAPYADYCILFAVTDPELNAARKGGITAFWVDTSAPGFEVTSIIPMLGSLSSNAAIISIEDLRVPEDHIIGEFNKGLSLALGGISKGRLSMSSMCIGLAEWALAKSIDYANQRETFGTTIGNHQAVQIKLAEMAMDIYSSKAAVARTAWLVEKKSGSTIKETSIVKALCTEMLGRVTDSAIQIHGAMGLTNELRLEEAWRHARKLRIPDGTAEIQRRTIAQRLLRGDVAL